MACSRHSERADFLSLSWTGRNVGSDRAEAGQRLAAALEAIPRETPVFLIGHSHGGSVIVYFLKMYPMLASKIAGAAFLSTPFVAMRLRDYWNDIAKVLFSIVAAVVFVCSAAISSFVANRPFIGALKRVTFSHSISSNCDKLRPAYSHYI